MLGDIDPYDFGRAFGRQQLGPVGRATPCVENTSSSNELGGPPVASEMLRLDQTASHDIRDEPLGDAMFETRQLGHDRPDWSAPPHNDAETGDNPTWYTKTVNSNGITPGLTR